MKLWKKRKSGRVYSTENILHENKMICVKKLPLFPQSRKGGSFLKKKCFRLAYDYYERWYPCPASGDEWELCAMEGARICSENGNDPFLMALMAAVYHELSRSKEGGDQSGDLTQNRKYSAKSGGGNT